MAIEQFRFNYEILSVDMIQLVGRQALLNYKWKIVLKKIEQKKNDNRPDNEFGKNKCQHSTIEIDSKPIQWIKLKIRFLKKSIIVILTYVNNHLQ